MHLLLILELIILLHEYTGKPQLEKKSEICSVFCALSDTKGKEAMESRKKKKKMFRSMKDIHIGMHRND